MTTDLKLHRGSKKETDEFAETMLMLTKEWKEQGWSDEYVLSFLDLYVRIYTTTDTVMGYVEV